MKLYDILANDKNDKNPNRKGHFEWHKDDIEIINPDKIPDRNDHFTWHEKDIVIVPHKLGDK